MKRLVEIKHSPLATTHIKKVIKEFHGHDVIVVDPFNIYFKTPDYKVASIIRHDELMWLKQHVKKLKKTILIIEDHHKFMLRGGYTPNLKYLNYLSKFKMLSEVHDNVLILIE